MYYTPFFLHSTSLGSGSHSPFLIHVEELGPLSMNSEWQLKLTLDPSITGIIISPMTLIASVMMLDKCPQLAE